MGEPMLSESGRAQLCDACSANKEVAANVVQFGRQLCRAEKEGAMGAWCCRAEKEGAMGAWRCRAETEGAMGAWRCRARHSEKSREYKDAVKSVRAQMRDALINPVGVPSALMQNAATK